MVVNLQWNQFVFLCVTWCPIFCQQTFFSKGPSLSLKYVYYGNHSCLQGQLEKLPDVKGWHSLPSWHRKYPKNEAIAQSCNDRIRSALGGVTTQVFRSWKKMMNFTWIFLECKSRKTFLAKMRKQKYVAEAEEAYWNFKSENSKSKGMMESDMVVGMCLLIPRMISALFSTWLSVSTFRESSVVHTAASTSSLRWL